MKAGATGGIDAVVKAINTHIDNAGVCYQGCGALMSMAVNGKTTDKHNQTIKHTQKKNEQLRTK